MCGAKYVVFHVGIDSLTGETVARRLNMRKYTKHVAEGVADSVPGGYVCPFGSNQACYVGKQHATIARI